MLYLIAGHGAGDPGSVGNGYTEAERARALCAEIKRIGGNSVVYLDPNRNWYKDNGISSLNIAKGDCLLECHMDSGVPTAKGGHVIILQGFNPDAYDNALADMLKDILPGRAQMIVQRSDLANPHRAAERGINYRLVEFGFITNANDVATFNNRLTEIAERVLKCFDIKAEKENPQPTPSQKIDTFYQVKAEGKQYAEVKNLEDYAGVENRKVSDIAIRFSDGCAKYRVHVLGGGWLPWVTGYNWLDYNNGYAGNGKAIDGLQVVHTGGKKAKYRVSYVGSTNYLPWVINDSDYAGIYGRAIDKVQICVE